MQQPNRLAAKEEGRLGVKALSDPDNIKALDKLHGMLKNCFGPFSSNVILQNELGGYAITTSACVRLINALPIENPLVRLVTTATVGHGNNFSDASLFTALLTLSLIQEGLKLDVHRHLISTVYELILQECLGYLTSEECPAKHKISFESTGELLKLARSVLTTKPGSMIDKEEADHIARLLLIAFISSVSEKEVSNLHLVGIEGQQLVRSEVKPGFIYNAPERYWDESKPLNCKKVGSKIRTVLVGCSMAGDSEDYIDGKYEVHARGVRKEDTVITHIKQWLDSVIGLEVGIVLCQKVVHNDIKELLQKHNIIVIERLGTIGARTVQKLTGGPLLQSLHSALTVNQCGLVQSIEQLHMYEKTYLHVQGTTEVVSTLMLCHHSEDALDELKACCEQAYSVLRLSMGQPYALYGGGCWLTQLAYHIAHKAQDILWLDAAECPPHMLHPIVNAFHCSLLRIPSMLRADREHFVDSTSHHHWMLAPSTQTMDNVTCACGAVEWNRDIELVAFEELLLSDNFQALKINQEKEKSQNVQNPVSQSTQETSKKSQSMQNRFKMYSRNMTSPASSDSIGEASVLDGFTSCVNGLQTAVLAANMVLSVSNVISDRY